MRTHPAQRLDKVGGALQEGKELGVDGMAGGVGQDVRNELVHLELPHGHRSEAAPSEERGRALRRLAGLVGIPALKPCTQQEECSSGRQTTYHLLHPASPP